MSDSDPRTSARKLVTLAAWPLIFAGFSHAVLAIADFFGAGVFSPTNEAVQPLMENSSIVLVDRLLSRVSLWHAYLGFNVSHGLGIGFLGLVNLLIAQRDVELFRRLPALLPLSIAFSSTLLLLCLTVWFYAPMLIVAWSSACLLLAFWRLRRAST